MIGIGMGISLGASSGGYVRRNLLTASGDLGNAAWQKIGTATATGTSLELPASNDAVAQSITVPAGIGVSATFGAILSGAGTITIRVNRLVGGGSFETTDETVVLSGTPTFHSVTHTIVNSGQIGFTAQILTTVANASTITVSNAQLELGTTATPYQPQP